MHIGQREDGRRQKQCGRQGDACCEQGATETVDAGKGEQPGEPGQRAYGLVRSSLWHAPNSAWATPIPHP